MNLGQLISVLGVFDRDWTVQIEGPLRMHPRELCSYRGYYEDLAIVPELEDPDSHQAPITVVRFLELLKSAIGNSFTGYKGGEFVMSEKRVVWISELDDVSDCLVEGAYAHGRSVFLKVKMGDKNEDWGV